MTTEEQMRLSAEWEARVVPDAIKPAAEDFGAIARALAYFGRPNEHDHRLALERELRKS